MSELALLVVGLVLCFAGARSLRLYVPTREFRYVGTAETFAETEPITDVGHRLGWTVVSMANDWERVFD